MEYLSTQIYPIIEQPAKQVVAQTPKPIPQSNNHNGNNNEANGV
jgi:hypothetical protein